MVEFLVSPSQTSSEHVDAISDDIFRAYEPGGRNMVEGQRKDRGCRQIGFRGGVFGHDADFYKTSTKISQVESDTLQSKVR